MKLGAVRVAAAAAWLVACAREPEPPPPARAPAPASIEIVEPVEGIALSGARVPVVVRGPAGLTYAYTVDGQPLARPEISAAELAEGEHVLAVSAPGSDPLRRTFRVDRTPPEVWFVEAGRVLALDPGGVARVVARRGEDGTDVPLQRDAAGVWTGWPDEAAQPEAPVLVRAEDEAGNTAQARFGGRPGLVRWSVPVAAEPGSYRLYADGDELLFVTGEGVARLAADGRERFAWGTTEAVVAEAVPDPAGGALLRVLHPGRPARGEVVWLAADGRPTVVKRAESWPLAIAATEAALWVAWKTPDGVRLSAYADRPPDVARDAPLPGEPEALRPGPAPKTGRAERSGAWSGMPAGRRVADLEPVLVVLPAAVLVHAGVGQLMELERPPGAAVSAWGTDVRVGARVCPTHWSIHRGPCAELPPAPPPPRGYAAGPDEGAAWRGDRVVLRAAARDSSGSWTWGTRAVRAPAPVRLALTAGAETLLVLEPARGAPPTVALLDPDGALLRREPLPPTRLAGLVVTALPDGAALHLPRAEGGPRLVRVGR